MASRLTEAQLAGVQSIRHLSGSHTTDGADPLLVEQLARRVLRPLRERARHFGYAIATHGSMARDIDLIAVPWTAGADAPERLANSLRQVLDGMYPIGLEVAPGEGQPKPHGRLCWSWWIRPWAYIDLSVFPPYAGSTTLEKRDE